MDQHILSRLLDSFIADLLAQKQRTLNAGREKVRVIITGDDVTSAPTTLTCLTALDRAGYQLLVTFSHSASRSTLQATCIKGIVEHCAGSMFDECGPQQSTLGEDYSSLFLPALSINSMSKIALSIRDNIASEWVFHALRQQKQITTTLNPECLNAPPALLSRLALYAATLEQYGIVISGQKIASIAAPETTSALRSPSHASKRLITLSDVRLHAAKTLTIDRNTLITPAAQDEIWRQHIAIIRN